MMKWRKSGKRTAPSCWTRSHGVMNGRFAGSSSTEPTKSRSESIVGRSRIASERSVLTAAACPRRRATTPSHVDLDGVAAQLHQLAPRLRLALAHQLGERDGGGGEADGVEADRQQAPRLRIERRVPELLGVHLAQALEAAHAPAALARALLLQAVDRRAQLVLVERVDLGG